MRNTVAALLATAGALSAQAAAAKPHVHIVATGGTIASTNYYSANVGKVGVDVLLKAVPQGPARNALEAFADLVATRSV